ncbi:MAG: hypothetical protein VB140_03305 [Burkholderia sp.]
MKTQWNGLRTSLVRNPFVSPKIMHLRCHCILTLYLCNNTL